MIIILSNIRFILTSKETEGKEMSKYQQLRQRLIENSNPEIASQMESYLKNKFKFLV